MDTLQTILGPDVLGWAAALLTLLTFFSADMRRLRLLALAGNAAFIAYGSMAQLLPVLVLHLALVPVNLWRLNQAFQRKPAAPHAKATHPQTAARRPSGWTPTPRGARISRRVRRGGDPSSATGSETGTAATTVRRHGAPCQA